jgi:hypothetical protein
MNIRLIRSFESIVGMSLETNGSFDDDLFEQTKILSSAWFKYNAYAEILVQCQPSYRPEDDLIHNERSLNVRESPTLVATPTHRPNALFVFDGNQYNESLLYQIVESTNQDS